MAGGYMGKVLRVDLSNREIKEEALDEKRSVGSWVAMASERAGFTANRRPGWMPWVRIIF